MSPTKIQLKTHKKKIVIHIFIIPCDIWGCLLPLNYFSALLTKAVSQLKGLYLINSVYILLNPHRLTQISQITVINQLKQL